MRAAHRIILALVALALAAVLIFPPWDYTFEAPATPQRVWPAPRSLIFAPPHPPKVFTRDKFNKIIEDYGGIRLSLRRLSVELSGIAMIGAIAGIMACVVVQRNPSRE